jgi:hypothetical protein
MPVVIKPRTYDEDFYQAVMSGKPVDTTKAKNSLGNNKRRRV